MKKHTRVLVIALTLALVLGLSACGGGGATKEKTVEGKFSIVSMAEGETVYEEDMLSMALGENYAETNYIEFKADNAFLLEMMGMTVEGSFKQDGNDISLKSEDESFNADGNPVKGVLDGDTFTIDQEGVKMVFKKSE